MQRAIMKAQLLKEEECRIAATREQGILLSDRSAVDPVVYAILTASDENNAEYRRSELVDSAEFQAVLPLYQQVLFVLLNPVPGWLVDDGVRSLNDQVHCLEVFRKVLVDLKIDYFEIGTETKDLEKRVALVLDRLGI